jgi:hypothetical protein
MTVTPASWKTLVRGRVPALPALDAGRLRRAGSRALVEARDWRRHGATAVAEVRTWRLPEWSTVKATSLALIHVAGVEGFGVKRFKADLWEVHEVSAEFASGLVQRAFVEEKADRLVVLNADPLSAQRIGAAAAAHGAAYRTTVSLRMVDLLPLS